METQNLNQLLNLLVVSAATCRSLKKQSQALQATSKNSTHNTSNLSRSTSNPSYDQQSMQPIAIYTPNTVSTHRIYAPDSFNNSSMQNTTTMPTTPNNTTTSNNTNASTNNNTNTYMPNNSETADISRTALLAALAAADAATNITPHTVGPFELPPLEYDYDALDPYIDEPTLRVHHDVLHQRYITRLNNILRSDPEAFSFTLNELLLFPDRLPSNIQNQVSNNAGGHYNHSLMWKILTPNMNQQPSGALGDAINAQFGSYEQFKAAFSAAAASVFGSGYAYLVLNPYGRLLIVTTSNQTTPIPLRTVPLIPLDMWEHAYFLQYEAMRDEYIKNYFNLINWARVGDRYEAALAVLMQ